MIINIVGGILVKNKNEVKTSLTNKELQVYNMLEQLPNNLKHLLLNIIKSADKNQISIYRDNIKELEGLIEKELVIINNLYHPYGNEISLIVLPNAPTLVNKLKYICIELEN